MVVVAAAGALGCSSSGGGDATSRPSGSVAAPLAADFELDVTYDHTGITACPATEVRLVDTSRGEPTSWRWTFPDGTTSDERAPVYGTGMPGGVREGDVTLVVTKGDQRSEARHALQLVSC